MLALSVNIHIRATARENSGLFESLGIEMKKIISRLSDKALSTLLREETAGACIPEVGQPCSKSYCSASGATSRK